MALLRFPFQQLRRQSTLFSLFPKTFGQPQFQVDQRALRKEYRQLQQQEHPDLTKNDTQSSLLNRAYTTLKQPLTRAQYLLELQGIDLSDESNTQQFAQPDVLFEVLDIHESLESVQEEEELVQFKKENDERMALSIAALEKLFKEGQWEAAAKEAVKLKYWVNIDGVMRNWEGGKPMNLVH